jgi:hypothetical protein
MGSKLSIFRKTVENVEKELSEGLNNLKVSESAQPSEPTPINADIKTEKVEEKCNCVDCKCDPCNCHLKDLPLLEPITETKVVAELNTQSLNEEQSIPSAESTKDEVITKENKPSEESPKEVKPEQTSNVESTPEETKVEETPKDNNEEKKCLCDPCECNPCNCCAQEVKQESDTCPQNDSQKQEESQQKQTEQPSADTKEVGENREESEKLVNQEMEPQNDSPVEEQLKESGNHEKTEKPNEETNKESDAQPVHQINDNVETPQESSQALEVQQN